MTTPARWEGSTRFYYQLYIQITTPQDREQHGVQDKYCTVTLNMNKMFPFTPKSFWAINVLFVETTPHFLAVSCNIFDVSDPLFVQNHWRKMAQKYGASANISSTPCFSYKYHSSR